MNKIYPGGPFLMSNPLFESMLFFFLYGFSFLENAVLNLSNRNRNRNQVEIFKF